MGFYEVNLSDTLGVGCPKDVRNLLHLLETDHVPLDRIAGHLHDTYGQALANAWEAYICVVRVCDSSVASVGGCPFAPGAKGNASTGVDLSKLAAVGAWILDKLPLPTSSRVGAVVSTKERRERRSTDR